MPESLARSLVPGTEYQRQLLAAQVQLQSGTAELQADLLQSQARLAELEAQVKGRGATGWGAKLGWKGVPLRAGRLPPVSQRAHRPPSRHLQVRKLELERTQHQLLLESLQQRHQADLELLEGAHRYPCSSHLGVPRLEACLS